ncbi:class I SAM-dependent methyltransferase [Pseudorhodoferax sp.]|uniref:class I SAM-dependent methyltransferase n=1 Tax=Pseudorhodoferax sp. TaxID=1993553 RepID=UPI002DD63506|nr:class I SAM-dependent methyltransferase [Pseudorhodoferax sp.]
MNATWTEGYVAELDYPHSYTAELNPFRMALPFLASGLAVPPVRHACELGYGQGLSLNIHAAAGSAQWHGTDFLPGQALHAQQTAEASGAGAVLVDQSFAEFCARDDLPAFDFIALHGVWSWVSAENRAVIVDFLRRKLRVGGVVYLGYNTLPGWSDLLPVRELLLQHTQRMGGAGQSLASRIQGALAFVEKLGQAGAGFAQAHPAIAQTLDELKNADPRYLAHEYLNADWQPMFFSDMAAALAPAKLAYACSAHHESERFTLSPEQQALLHDVHDPVLREGMRDFCVNQRFRKDYWVKGARRLSAVEQAQALREVRVVLQTAREDVQRNVSTPRGELRFDTEVFKRLLDLLGDHVPRRLGEIERQLANVALPQLVESVLALVAAGVLASAQPDAVAAAAKVQTDRLNLHLMVRALGSAQVNDLASPLTGGGVALTRVEQLLLYAALDPSRKPEDLGRLVWQVLQPQNVKMLRDGKALETEADNLAELARVAREFVRKRLPLLHALGVVPNVTKG